MFDPAETAPQAAEEERSGREAPGSGATALPTHRGRADRLEQRRWWLGLFLQPLLLLLAGAALIAGLGQAQHLGWISAGGGEAAHHHASDGAESVSYICPMMCTPPQSEPGRCPVCAMELVPASAGAATGDREAVQIDPAARRIANIRTVAVTAMPLTRTVRAVGELAYNEGTLKTISAYVDGRLERLYADYTGIVVEEGDHLALLYSPKLYSAQVEYLLARKARDEGRTANVQRSRPAGHDLLGAARQRLIELGMTEPQIEELEQSGQASSRLHLNAPNHGTVIEKRAVEGQYVQEGDPVYRLADLSTVWLMLRLFPEDAAAIRYGQKVEAEVQSLPGQPFSGRVAFIDPVVEPTTRTVGIRVVIPNDDGRLRAGDFAKAVIEVPLAAPGQPQRAIYDPELAHQWVSPRHPHVVDPAPGHCRECGVPLVPAEQLGFTDEPGARGEVLTVPRDAVLMAGGSSVLYVETEPGRFEIRRVVLGPSLGDRVVIHRGIEQGDLVAARGNFLIDSQMQLAGNPSLIDPTRAVPSGVDPHSDDIMRALADLSDRERQAALQQRICPVTELALGAMGPPVAVAVEGEQVLICCQGCQDRLLDDPRPYLVKLASGGGRNERDPKISSALAKLPASDRTLAERQETCPVADFPLGAMGTPVRVDVRGKAVFICCEGCRGRLLGDPETYLEEIAAHSHDHDHDADHAGGGRGEDGR